jgi:ABC-type Fe3+/spermidine/putrescine transport system ATPase subunit
MAVQLSGIHKRFGNVAALAGIEWTIEPGTCAGLVGSSGSGKTTLLRIVAGLEQPDVGSVRYLGAEGHQRATRPTIGMVFQNLGLWPHLTARQHVSCVLDRATAAERSAESLLDEVRLPRGAWDRRPSELSGGEGQRVALARALACGPQLLLLDEPLAHLDAALRAELLEQVSELVRRRSLTAIYVTHAWTEAATLCQRIGVLAQGHLEQSGTPEELFWHPASATVAGLTGPRVVLPRQWLADGKITADPQAPVFSGLLGADNSEIWLRPQQLRITAAAGLNCWRIIACRPISAHWLIDLEHSAGHRLQLPTGVPAATAEAIGLLLQAAPIRTIASCPDDRTG